MANRRRSARALRCPLCDAALDASFPLARCGGCSGAIALDGGADDLLVLCGQDVAAGVAVVAVDGEVDMATDQRLRHAILSLDDRCRRVTLDLEAVRFIDARGLGVLLEAAARADAAGGMLTLRSAPRAVLRILDALDLTDRFAFEPDHLLSG